MSDYARAAREQAAHDESERFKGRSVAIILEWDARGGVSVRHAGGHGVDREDAAIRALSAPATPSNTVEVAQAEIDMLIGEYSYGKWARNPR